MIDGYSYGDINVICSDDSPYISVVESVFEKYEIPAFIAKPRMIDTSPLVRLVLTAFKIAEFGFRTEDVLSLAKSGLCGLNSSEISVLENYVYMWKIEGKDWLKNFEKSPNGFSKKETGIKLETLESYRLKLVEPLVNFIKKTKNSTGVKLCEATYTLLVAYESEKYVWSNYKNLEKLLLLDEAQEQVRIWDEFIETLDQFAGILGEKTVEFKFFSKLLKDVLSKQEIMDVPLKLDSVMFLVSDKMKAQGKVSFLIGCVQDEFPKIPNTDTIFTQFERKYLSDFPFIKNIEEEILTQRFYAYTSALSCSEKLYVSYVSSQNPSEIISQIQSVCSVDVIEDLPYSYFANSYKSALSVAVKICRENSVESASLKKLIKENEVLDKKFTSIINSIDKKDLIIENANTAQNLFNLNYLSPSQIDTYHRCKFRFFCQYGIKAKEKSLAEIDVLEYGTIMHYVFENVLKEQEKYISLSEILLAEMVKNLIVDYCDKELGGYLNLDVRDKYRLTRVTKTAVVIVTRLMKELSQSKFSPKYLELKLEKDTDFPALEVIRENGEKINVGGIIDRVDIYENDKGKYVRIVDYKTGHKDFKLSDILQGISLQMLIYLSALQNTGLLPAGVLYMPSSFPEISASRDQKAEKLEEERSKKMCMSGMVLQDTQIVKAMEEKLEGKYIPIKLKKDGSYSSTENLIKNNELEKVFSFVRNIIATMANDLASGNVKAEPLMINTNACSYCPYACVCLIENNQDVIEQKLNKQTALDIIENKLLSEKEKE
ncbi:MAG: PD-(D/E)XK nuclease family protein [Clostridia bacterium]